MARIRSLHPGFFTDEAVVTLSPQAQVFLMGLWTECDDQGVFEWKPITLKMRLLPATNADVGTLLSELATANAVKKVEVGGLQYGLVRNFRKYQRPKKPNSVHPLPEEFRTYVGLKLASGEPEEGEAGASSELSPQMEEGGGRMKGRSESNDSDRSASEPENTGEAAAFACWNEAAERHPRWPKAEKLTPARRTSLKARLREAGGLDGFRGVLERAERSSFVRDEMHGWSLDWFLKPANFTKVREGNYDRDRGAGAAPRTDGWSAQP
jgi:hypothetical protein